VFSKHGYRDRDSDVRTTYARAAIAFFPKVPRKTETGISASITGPPLLAAVVRAPP